MSINTRQTPKSLYTIILMTSVFIGNKGDIDNLNFHHELVTSVIEGNIVEEGEAFSRFRREKLCEVAKTRFNQDLVHIDETYKYEVHEYKFIYENGQEATKVAVECATLPSIFLRPGNSYDQIILTMIRSTAGKYKMIGEHPEPTSIELTKTSTSLKEHNILMNLNDATRQELCRAAREKLVFLFTDNYVLKPHTYNFIYESFDRKITYDAIACPTYPPTYLRLDSWNIDIMVISFIKPAHQIEVFENVLLKQEDESQSAEQPATSTSGQRNDFGPAGRRSAEELNRKLLSSLPPVNREDLCSQALLHMNYEFEVPELIMEPNFYEFDFGGGLKREYFVLNCTAQDNMFLHLVNSEKESARIEILLRKSKLWEKSTVTRSPSDDRLAISEI